MGYQSNFIAHLPATLLFLTSTVFLALSALNTPLIKSLYFLKATYTTGSNAGEVRFGTLGFCFERGAGESCTGPKIGYEIDLNSIFNLDTGSLISIPDAVGKYLTYVLILHVVALISSVITILFRLLDTVDNVSLLCFPSLASWFTSAVTFAAFVVDLVIFYIAKARIDSVDGASAEIGSCVWFTLVAWVLPVIAGCCCSINAVENRRKPRDKKRRDDEEYPQSAGGYARVPGPPLNKYGEREVSVPLDPGVAGLDDGKKSEDGAGYYGRGQQGDQHYHPRGGSSQTGHAVPGTYPPPQHQDPYSTGYYEDYGTHRDQGDLGAGGGGTGTFAGVGSGMAVGAVAGAGAAGMAGYGAHRSPSGQAGYGGNAGYDGYPPVQQGYDGQQGYSHHSHDDGYGNNAAYAQPMPMPVPQALSPDHTANRVDPYSNPSYMQDSTMGYPSQSNSNYPPPAQDAYGGYETPNTARPVDNDYGYASGYGHQDGSMVAAPIPRAMNSHLPDGTPNFPLDDSMTSPIHGSGQGHSNMYDTTAHEGMNAPPSYAVAADQSGTAQPTRRNPSMDKSGGYFR